jgi:hypothetical protein
VKILFREIVFTHVIFKSNVKSVVEKVLFHAVGVTCRVVSALTKSVNWEEPKNALECLEKKVVEGKLNDFFPKIPN